jgi:hypothetical protein
MLPPRALPFYEKRGVQEIIRVKYIACDAEEEEEEELAQSSIKFIPSD